MTKPADDFEAVRTVVDAVQGFDANDQQRIFRWAAEKLGLPQPFGTVAGTTATHSTASPPAGSTNPPAPLVSSGGSTPQDIKSFVAAKNPRRDVQFAATVAHYYQFEAPQAERKTSINKDDLQEACRKVGRTRLVNPGQTLRNAHTLGLLDKAGEAGAFSINTVGENLVTMTLPGDGNATGAAVRKRVKKAARKKTAVKKAPVKKAKKA